MNNNKIIIPFTIGFADKILNDYTRKAKLVTKDGRNVRILCTNWKSKSGCYSIICIVEQIDENKRAYEEIMTYTIDGKFTTFSDENKNDLMIEIDKDFFEYYKNNNKLKWLPKEDEEYYYIDDNNQIHMKFYHECEYLSQLHIKTNNVFLTRENADIVAKKSKQLYDGNINF